MIIAYCKCILQYAPGFHRSRLLKKKMIAFQRKKVESMPARINFIYNMGLSDLPSEIVLQEWPSAVSFALS